MANKQYGLILPNQDRGGLVKKPSIFDEDSDSDSASVRPTGLKKPLKKQDKINRSRAVEEDPTVYQYDEVYDEMDKKRKESKLSRKDLDRKPKYISRLIAAADRRKRENERRIERQVQKEREAEGSEFKDKESYVTSAYKKKLEEMRLLDEQDRREEYLESIGDVRKQANLDGFYRHLYDQQVNYEDTEEGMKEIKPEVTTENMEEKPLKSDSESVNDGNPQKSRKRKYRKHAESESDEENNEITTEVKTEHLPSNLDADSDFSIDSSDDEDDKPASKEDVDVKPEQKEEKIPEEPPPVKVEEKIEEPEKPKIDIWKKRTVGEVFDAALQRYFERQCLRDHVTG